MTLRPGQAAVLYSLLATTTLTAGSLPAAAAASPQIAVTPAPMGWSSWNPFGEAISQAVISQQADALVVFDKTLAPGTPPYNHINIDGGYWHAVNGRDAQGAMVLDPTAWSGGSLAPTVQHIHADGLLAGAYTDAGQTGCGTAGGSQDYMIPDMLRFATDGFDYVKVDFCGGRAENADPLQLYSAVAYAKQYAAFETGQNMYLSICDWGYYGPTGFPDANQGPWSWAPGLSLDPGDMWRTGDDITLSVGPNGTVSLENVLLNFHANNHPQAQHTGYYNDPDLMVAGMNGLDLDPNDPVQSRAHMSLWAVAGSPLILGIDLTTLAQRPALAAVLSNPEVIALDQDARGMSAIQVGAPQAGQEVWARLLSGYGRRAATFLNTTSAPVAMTVTAKQLGLDPSASLTARNVWDHVAVATQKNRIRVAVPAQGATMLLVQGRELAAVPADTATAGSTTVATLPLAPASSAAAHNQGPTALDITYRNVSNATEYATMTTNGANQTVVALPPTGRRGGTVSVTSNMVLGSRNQLVFRPIDVSGTPTISGVAAVSAPVPVYQPIYPADASGNVLTGTAVVQACSTCSDGQNVGYIGTGGGSSGMLTINGIVAPVAGLYRLTVGYLNGDSVDRQATISVNGSFAAPTDFPRGKDWNTVLVQPVLVELNKGANSVTFSNQAGYAPNFDGVGIPTLVAAD